MNVPPAVCLSLIRFLSLSALVLATAVPALAQPANDHWANREVISALPFTDTEAGIAAATTEGTDPLVLCRLGATSQGGNSVWYTYITGASTEYLTLSTGTSNYDSLLSVYTGSPGAFRLVAGGCSDDGLPASLQSRIAGLRLRPNTPYSFEVAQFSASAVPATLRFAASAAVEYVVNTGADVVNGSCTQRFGCSLRDAISASNANPGAIFLAAVTYRIGLPGAENDNASGDFDIRSSVGIYGMGVDETTIDANHVDRILHVDPLNDGDATVIVGDLTITNGTVTGDGGGILAAGASSFLSLDGVAITGNVATGFGGGLRTLGRGTIARSTFDGSLAGGAGGGLSFAGGADTTVELRETTVSNNASLATATAGGGGIHSAARLRFNNGTISGNRANFHGGGLHTSGTGSVVILSSTIANNTSDFDADNTGNGGGLRLEGSGPMTIGHTVIGNNTDDTAFPAADCSKASAAVLSTSFNHLEDTAGGCAFVGTGDATGTDAEISPTLANNGGPTQTHLPLALSPIIDAGNPAGCQDYLGQLLATDQRFAERLVDGDGDGSAVCDKGSVESGDRDLIFRDGFDGPVLSRPRLFRVCNCNQLLEPAIARFPDLHARAFRVGGLGRS